MARISKSGKVSALRVQRKGDRYGPQNDGLEAEVLFRLDATGATTYGFQLRDGSAGGAQRAMFHLLKEAFVHGFVVHIAYNEHAHAHECYRIAIGDGL